MNKKETVLNNILMIIENLKSILKIIWNNKNTHFKILITSGGMVERGDMMIKFIIIQIKTKNIQNGKRMVRKYKHKVI